MSTTEETAGNAEQEQSQQQQRDQGAPTHKTVNLWGKELTLPAEEADALIALRDERTKGYNEAQARLAEIEQAKAEAERKAQEEADRAKAVELAKKGEIDELRNVLTRQHNEKIQALQNELKRNSIASTLARRGDIASSAIDDVAALLFDTLEYTDGKLVPKGTDGPGAATGTTDEVIGQWLEARPHYLLSRTPAGSGGDTRGDPPKTKPGKLTKDEFLALGPRQRAEFIAAGGEYD